MRATGLLQGVTSSRSPGFAVYGEGTGQILRHDRAASHECQERLAGLRAVWSFAAA